MEDYIVRIQSAVEGRPVYFGTGIVVSDHEVLTARHVVSGKSHLLLTGDGSIPLSVQNETDSAVILHADQRLPFRTAEIFSVHEILDTQSTWTSDGYITSEQTPHSVAGHGIVKQEPAPIDWDHTLSNIESGHTQNYKGLSGAPVFSHNRIIGILQVQETVSSGVLGLRMLGVEAFRELLPLSSLRRNEYEELIDGKSAAFSRRHIEENKRSRKYIPDIFVENGPYKEQLRYFADPVLFLKKVLCKCKGLDFTRINQIAASYGLPQINQPVFPCSVAPEQMEEVSAGLSDLLSAASAILGNYDSLIHSKNLCWEDYYDFRDKTNHSLKYILKGMEENVRYTNLQFLLLTQPAGQGKTNFLCDFTENFLLKKGYCVWYFNAYEFYEPPANILRKKLSLEGQYDISYAKQVLERRWHESKRPVVVVIDGLNENIRLPNFEQALIGFLQECETLPFVKVIMSTRDELLEERFGRMIAGQKPERFLHVKLDIHDERFKRRIFAGYLRFFNIDIRPNTLSNRTYQQLTGDVLLLRFFCEVHQGARQLYMYDIYKYAVYEQYCAKKAEDYRKMDPMIDAGSLFRELLDHICEYMIQNKTYFHIPIEIFNPQQQKMIWALLENDVVLKGEDVIEHGLLKEQAVVISFTFDEFRDYCLTNYILRNSKDEKTFFEFWDMMVDETQTVLEGVEKYAFYLARTQNGGALLPIIKKLPEYNELYWAFIWDIEDKYVTEEDVLLWKDELLREGEYIGIIMQHLLWRDDCDYFPTANIQLIFEVLDEFLKDLNRYNRLINRIFGIPRKDRWGTVIRSTQTPIPFNTFAKYLGRQASNSQWSQLHRELFRLSIYLYDIGSWDAQEAWNRLYGASPEVAVQLLREMNAHASSLIQGNVYDILIGLEKRDDGYDLQILSLREENSFGKELPKSAFSIAQLFLDEDDE